MLLQGKERKKNHKKIFQKTFKKALTNLWEWVIIVIQGKESVLTVQSKPKRVANHSSARKENFDRQFQKKVQKRYWQLNKEVL